MSDPEVPDLSSENDDDLLVQIGWQREEPALAREACAELFRRHVDYLFRECSKRCGKYLGGDAGVQNVVSDTFLHVYFHAAERFMPSGSKDPDQIRRHVRAWLGTVAKRVVQ
jgi:DNA-directed RNA polymerase specialized sigma24 family protein